MSTLSVYSYILVLYAPRPNFAESLSVIGLTGSSFLPATHSQNHYRYPYDTLTEEFLRSKTTQHLSDRS